MKYLLGGLVLSAFALTSSLSFAEKYVIDTKGAHAFVQFRIKHLGYSWLYGDFKEFDGEFNYDKKDSSKNSITMKVDVTSLDSNHSERDKHLRGAKFLNVDNATEATFKSTAYKTVEGGLDKITGDLTLMGITKSVTFDVEHVGGGRDPWGGYREGFQATATLQTRDFGMKASKNFPEVEIIISIEGCLAPNDKCSG